MAGGASQNPRGVPTGSRALQAAVCHRNGEKEKGDFTVLQMAAWGSGSGSAGRRWLRGADLRHAADLQVPQTPPAPACAKPSLQTRAGHEDPSDPLLAPSRPRGRRCPGRGGPERIPGCQVGAKNPQPELGWPPASPYVPHASALQPSASPGCLPSQPHGHGPASLAPQKARERSDEPGTGRHPWVPNTSRLLPGHGGAPKPVLPAPEPPRRRPRPLHRFLPSPCPHSPLGKATRGRGSAQSMAAGTTTPQSRRRAAVGMAGGGRLAPLGGPGTVPVGRARVREPQEGCVSVSPPLPDEASGNEPGLGAGRGWGGGAQHIELCTASDVGESFPPATAAPTTASPGPSHGKSSARGCPDAPASSPGEPLLSHPREAPPPCWPQK